MPPPQNSPRLPFVLGAVAAGAALVASVLMAAQHLWAVALPGCGPASRCAAAAASAWGSIPGLGWPVSFVGASYFAAVLTAWLMSGGSAPGVRWLIRVGAALSVLYVGVMVIESLLCPYCLAAHGCNLVLWVSSERARPARAPRAAVAWPALVFVGVSVVLGIGEGLTAGAAREQAERRLAETTGALAGGAAERAFTGRYRIGPEAARVRVVVFSDYQCPDCRRIDADLRRLLSERDDLSVSMKHFPFCSQCNPHMPTCPHANACWAARAAEAAGMLGGPDGFRRMHEWLFDRGGAFTDAELSAALPRLGFEARAFIPVMTSDETLRRVRADIDEAISLGLQQTPFLFINGVELRGWNAPDAVRRAVAAAAAAPSSPGGDRPPTALEKFIADWRAQPARAFAVRPTPLDTGPTDARVTILMFGGFQEPFTAEADAMIRASVVGRSDARYLFRHFPLDRSCNPGVPTTQHPQACRFARAVEAAALMTSPEKARTFRDALITEASAGQGDPIPGAAALAGLHLDTLLSTMELPEVSGAVTQDIASANQLGVTAIPLILINGRQVGAWRLDGENVLGRIIDEASR